MTHPLVEKYQMGMIVDGHLVVECLYIVDPENPGLVLSSLPDNILHLMRQFAREYQPGRMIANYGVMPAQDQVLAASRWIDKLPQLKADKTA